MKYVSVFLLSLYISTASMAGACVQGSNSLPGWVGLDSSSGTVFATLGIEKNECECSHARFSSANTDVKMALTILLSSKVANKKVRVDFKETGDCDSAYRVYMQ